MEIKADVTEDGPVKEYYVRLAERLGARGTGHMPQIMAHVATPRQARVLLELNQAPQPAKSAEEIAQALGIEVQTTRDDLELLFKRGLAFPRDFQHRDEWRFARSLMQIHDSTLCERGTYTEEDKAKLFALWRIYDESERFESLAEEVRDAPRCTGRIIPAWRSVMDNPNLQSWEDWRQIFKEKPLMTVVNCPCRPKMKNCDRPIEVCINFDRNSEYDLASGHGRQISYEEALQIQDDAARAGLIHTASNSRKITVICNCCDCCCYGAVPSKMYGLPLGKRWAKSRYQAQVNQQTCTGCQQCVDRCMFDAIEIERVPGSKRMKARIDAEKCFGCGLCFVACKPEAISMECVRPEEHVPAPVVPYAP